MANRKISDLTALTATATGDLLPIVDISEAAAADKNKKITIENLFKGIPGNVGIGTSSPSARLQVDAPTSSRSYSSSIFNFSNIHLDGITSNSTTSALTFASGGGGGAAIAFGRGTGYDTQISFWTNSAATANTATQQMVLSSAGRLGIGTNSPQSALDIGPETFQSVRTYLSSVTDTYHLYRGTPDSVGFEHARVFSGRDTSVHTYGSYLAFYTEGKSSGTTDTSVERLRIDSSGRVGIGTASPVSGYLTTIAGSSAWVTAGANFSIEPDAATGANGVDLKTSFSNGGNGPLKLWTGGSERLRIDASGRVGIGTSSPYTATTGDTYSNTSGYFAHTFRQDNTGGYAMGIGSDSFVFTYFYPNSGLSGGPIGGITHNGSSTSFVTSSDYRLKENVTAVGDGITRLLQLKPSRFNFIANPDHTVDGFIAHEAQAVVPECVTGTKDEVDDDGNPVYHGIDQAKLVPLLTAALQEAIAKIETLEARLTAAGIA
jgi:hypothetical protein